VSYESRVVAVDKDSGFEQVMHVDNDTGAITLHNRQDVTAIVEHNKRLFNANESGWKGDFHKVASIPLSLYYELQRKGILNDEKALKKWLQDPDNRVFRTKHGSI
jgi:hypothetical protein